MKRSTRLAIVLGVLVPSSALAQNSDQWCCDQSFPYYFCSPPNPRCSRQPVTDGAFRAPLPACVSVDQFPDNATWQPNAGAPTDDYPEEPTFKGNTEHEYWYYLGEHDQWAQDLKRFKDGLSPIEPHWNGGSLYDEDYYYGQSDYQYPNDLDAYNRALQNYRQQFNQAQAGVDATNALMRWYVAACGVMPSGTPATCCISIIADENRTRLGGIH